MANFVSDINLLKEENNELKIKKDSNEVENTNKIIKVQNDLHEQTENTNKLTIELEAKKQENATLQDKILQLENQISSLEKDKKEIDMEKNDCFNKIVKLNEDMEKVVNENKMLKEMKNENIQLLKLADEKDLGNFFYIFNLI